MSENKTITSEQILKAAADYISLSEPLDWNGVEILVKKNLSLFDVDDFVDAVVNSCFDENGEYNPELRDFATRSMTILFYTNCDLPEDLSIQHTLLFNSTLYFDVLRHIDGSQFEKMIDAISEKINYRLNTNIKAFENKIKLLFDQIEEFSNSMSVLFDGVENKDVTSLFNAVADSAFNLDDTTLKVYKSIKEDGDNEQEQ